MGHLKSTRERLTGSARRASILDAAADLFGSRGFDATRMDDVAERAGVAKGLLYKHFPSKDALFEALLDEHASAFTARLAQTIRPVDGYNTLVAVLSMWVEHLSDATHVRFSDPGGHGAYEAVRDRVRDVIAAAIRSAEPRVDAGRAWLLAAALQGAAESAGLAWARRPGGLKAEEVVQLVAAFCWEGLAGLSQVPSDA